MIELDRFNHYSHILATTVYIQRFCYRTGMKGTPSTSEIEAAEFEWIRTLQRQHYPQVLDYLSSDSHHKMDRAPPIVRQLHLILDGKGMIRTKGRFHAESSLILLPQHSRFTHLLILSYHHHIGTGGTIVALRQRFWVPSVRSVTCRLLHKCLK